MKLGIGKRPYITGARIAGRWYVTAWGLIGQGATMADAIADLNARGKAWASRWMQ